MGCIQSQFLLMLRYTTDATKAEDSYTGYQLSVKELQQEREQLFSGALLKGVDEEIDVAKHIVQVSSFCPNFLYQQCMKNIICNKIYI